MRLASVFPLRSFRRRPLRWLALVFYWAIGAQGVQPVGAVTSRGFNGRLGPDVNNARVVIESLRLKTFTDEIGNDSVPRVPPGRRAEGNFTLNRGEENPADRAVVLDAFTVAAKRVQRETRCVFVADEGTFLEKSLHPT